MAHKCSIVTLLVAACSAPVFATIVIPTVPVGDPGNVSDPATGFGGVAYAYNIGTTEVTIGQYAAFLNAVAATDPYGLYNLFMITDRNIAGISRVGASGSYSYRVLTGSANHPITFVNWGDAARFANWLQNGQPIGPEGPGTTETGAYTLNGATSDFLLNAVSRNAGATWFIPNENEWYKAAYYQPASKGGDSDSYWAYPMRTNSTPYSGQPPGATPDNTRVGNFIKDDGLANGYDDGLALTGSPSISDSQNYLTDVGAYTASSSFYGTFDQGGNVWEWNEAILLGGSTRGLRGSSFLDDVFGLAASIRTGGSAPTHDDVQFGFRVANIPEPDTAVLAIVGCALTLLWKGSRRLRAMYLPAVVLAAFWATPVFAITIPTVPVGDLGNANDPATGGVYGGVGYAYRIGTTEVTVGQYAAFLNAVAATDTYGLYNPRMGTDPTIAGIAQTGASGSYSYSVIGSQNHPITYVSWGDAARFANWLHNGQPSGAEGPGTTETGAYTLNGAMTDTALNAVSRNAGATWFIPSESEWYKAAYYQPVTQGGAANGYWSYPMGHHSPQLYSDQPPGATPDNTAVGNFYDFNYSDFANGYNAGYAVTGSMSFINGLNYLTDAGAYTSSSSFYGTFDQGGNVWEWNEAVISGSFRGVRGGSWRNDASNMAAAERDAYPPALLEDFNYGFRVATAPEPSGFLLVSAALAGLVVLVRRGRAGRWVKAARLSSHARNGTDFP